MSDPFFFGYGSLVNRATHAYEDAHRAEARGWARRWRHTLLHPVAFLTAVPCPGAAIQGLVARVPGADWSALDLRERAYVRHACAELTHSGPASLAAQIYAIPPEAHGDPETPHPILLSYLDAVAQGYLREFGEDGVRQFFETTGGWETEILDDRADPQYPRAQTLTASERAMVDAHLDARALPRIPAENRPRVVYA